MTRRNIKILTLDTETRGLFGQIFLAGLFDGEQYWVSQHMDEIVNVLHDLAKEYECHVYVHNLDFDLSKFSRLIISQSDFDNSIFINNSVVIFSTRNNIIFHDSYRLLPASLERLSKDFGLEETGEGKVSLDEYIKEQGYADKEDFFMRVPPDDPILLHYLYHDCAALYKIITTVKNISGLEWKHFLACPTVASLAMKVFKHQYEDDYNLAISTKYGRPKDFPDGLLSDGEYAEAMIREGYYGGRTEVFHPHMEEGFHYDVNSLYPYVMKVNTFPVGWFHIFSGSRASIEWDFWRKQKNGGGFLRCVVEVPEDMFIPPLPKRVQIKHAKKLIFPVGILEGVWTFEEVEMALEYGCKLLEIKEMIYFKKRAPIFQKFVTDMEVMKTTSTGAKRNFSKLMQNSLYGKFGMRRERKTISNIEKVEELEAEGESYYIIHNTTLGVDMVSHWSYSTAKYIQPHIAAYVTSFARILLYRSLMACVQKGWRVSYCDTDSMVTTHRLPDELVHETEYGKWKLEYELKEGIFIQPKLYYERTQAGKEVFKAKGVPGSIIKKDFSRATYTGIVDAIQRGEDRYFLFEDHKVRGKFGSALQQDVDPDRIITIRKCLNLRGDQKRIMDFVNNTSRPHKIDDLHKAQEEYRQWLIDEAPDPLSYWQKMLGAIRLPKKGERYYGEVYSLPTQTRKQFFRKRGLPLDEFADQCGISVRDLLDILRNRKGEVA